MAASDIVLSIGQYNKVVRLLWAIVLDDQPSRQLNHFWESGSSIKCRSTVFIDEQLPAGCDSRSEIGGRATKVLSSGTAANVITLSPGGVTGVAILGGQVQIENGVYASIYRWNYSNRYLFRRFHGSFNRIGEHQ